MKKATLILAALALVLGISQCKKQEEPAQYGQKQHIVLTASNGNDGSKVNVSSVTSKLNLTWESTDKITVSGAVEGTLDFKGEPGSTSAKFEGTVTRKEGNEVVFSVGSQPTYMEQAGTLEGLKGLIHLQGISEYKEDGKYGNVDMTLQYAVLKLDLSGFAATTKTGGTTVKISINGSDKASVANITTASKAVYVAIPADETPSVYTFYANGVVANASWKLKTNTFYTKKEETPTGESIVIVPTAPVFSVAASRTVEFSKGNLWYDGTNFHFENSQTAYPIKWKTTHVGLFRWSTTRGDAVSSSATPVGDGNPDDVFFTNSKKTVAKPTFQVDGEEIGTWRNLSRDEMEYLLNAGNALSGARTDANRFALAKVDGVNGLLIFPDKYNDGRAVSGITGVAAVNNVDDVVDFPDDNIPTETWITMESCGVVFLPAAGSRDGTVFKNGGSGGSYWLSAAHDGIRGACMRFYKDDGKYKVNCMGNLRENGYSVRLVR